MSWTMTTPSVASGMMMLQKVVAEVMGMVAQVMEVVVEGVAEVVVKQEPRATSA
ncbi:hypothetical protein [Nitrosospira sp. NRS527]|uniref:hypothetical protein n=1 Tax=Nitrosospira sp. NRS527 TaxID=155925 RepID=UPI001BCEAA6E|nr:hypothetical protein [Nitrosospira sp. NRS527]